MISGILFFFFWYRNKIIQELPREGSHLLHFQHCLVEEAGWGQQEGAAGLCAPCAGVYREGGDGRAQCSFYVIKCLFVGLT